MAKWRLNNLFVKLMICFWLVSGLSIGGLLIAQKLSSQEPLQAIDPIELRILNRIAERVERMPLRALHKFDISREVEARFPNMPEGFKPPRFVLLDSQGETLTGRRAPRSVSFFRVVREENQLAEPASYQFRRERVFGPQIVTISGQDYELYGRIDRPPPKPKLYQWLDRTELLLGLALLLSGLIYGALAWHLSRGLRSLRHSAERIAAGELAHRSEASVRARGDEIGQLAQAFDQMGDSVQAMMQSQQRLMSDISHELRTPLTRLQLALAIAKKKGQESKELARMGYETEQIEQMIQELLQLSRTSLQASEDKQRCRLSDTLAGVLDDAVFEAEQQKISLQHSVDADPELAHSPKLIGRAVENLLRNAIRYANSAVYLRQYIEDESLVIEVSDDGPGVEPDQLEQIFQPFYRPSDARERESGGAGLGLAICAAAVKGHGGQIKADRGEHGGLRVRLELPL